MNRKLFSLAFCVVVLSATGLLMYHSINKRDVRISDLHQLVLENVNALSEIDEPPYGKFYDCYRLISSAEVYGTFHNEMYCGICNEIPVTKASEDSICRKQKK